MSPVFFGGREMVWQNSCVFTESEDNCSGDVWTVAFPAEILQRIVNMFPNQGSQIRPAVIPVPVVHSPPVTRQQKIAQLPGRLFCGEFSPLLAQGQELQKDAAKTGACLLPAQYMVDHLRAVRLHRPGQIAGAEIMQLLIAGISCKIRWGQAGKPVAGSDGPVEDQLLLALEMMVKCSRRHACRAGNVPDAHSLEAMGVEQAEGLVDQELFCLFCLPLPGRRFLSFLYRHIS